MLATLIRAYFSPLHSTAQRYIYAGSHDGTVYIYGTPLPALCRVPLLFVLSALSLLLVVYTCLPLLSAFVDWLVSVDTSIGTVLQALLVYHFICMAHVSSKVFAFLSCCVASAHVVMLCG